MHLSKLCVSVLLLHEIKRKGTFVLKRVLFLLLLSPSPFLLSPSSFSLSRHNLLRPFTLLHFPSPHRLITRTLDNTQTHHSIIHFLSWSQGPPSGTKDKQKKQHHNPSTHTHIITLGRTNVVLHFDFFCPWSSYGPSSMPFWPPSSPLGTSCHRPPRSMTSSRPTLLPSKYKKFCRVYVCVVG